MATIEMSFTVTKVVSAALAMEQTIDLVQDEESWRNPDYKGCKLQLVCINDDALRAWGPGKSVQIKLEV